jgi:hypothetical protein
MVVLRNHFYVYVEGPALIRLLTERGADPNAYTSNCERGIDYMYDGLELDNDLPLVSILSPRRLNKSHRPLAYSNMYIYQVTALIDNDHPVVGALLEVGADPSLDSGEAPFLRPVYEIALRSW